MNPLTPKASRFPAISLKSFFYSAQSGYVFRWYAPCDEIKSLFHGLGDVHGYGRAGERIMNNKIMGNNLLIRGRSISAEKLRFWKGY